MPLSKAGTRIFKSLCVTWNIFATQGQPVDPTNTTHCIDAYNTHMDQSGNHDIDNNRKRRTQSFEIEDRAEDHNKEEQRTNEQRKEKQKKRQEATRKGRAKERKKKEREKKKERGWK